MAFSETGPYFLRKGVLTAVHPPGLFLMLVGTEADGVEVNVLVHPDFSTKEQLVEGYKKVTKQER